MDTVSYEGKEHRFVDYKITDIMQMAGLACRPLDDKTGVCVVLCHSSKKEYLKKLLHHPLPVESHLDQCLHDHINAEVVTRTIENKQDAVDYLTWTLLYRRLSQNPNYYNLQGSSHMHLSDHMSELIENTVNDLAESKCVSVEDDVDIATLNLGMVASFYYIQYTTVELFASSITAKTKIKGLIEILSAASEYSLLEMRMGEENVLQGLAAHLPQAMPSGVNFEEPEFKAIVLLQSHFSRRTLQSDLKADLNIVLMDSVKLIQALVDTISSQGWLKPALAAMELSQMVVQGLWDKDSPLMQIPHFTSEILERCKKSKTAVTSVFDILEIDDDERESILQLPEEKVSDVAMFCNSYPNLDVNFKLHQDGESLEEVVCGDAVTLSVEVLRDVDEDDDHETIGKVVSAKYPKEKVESWWFVIGNKSKNTLLSIKKATVGAAAKVKLDFVAPEDPGDYTLTLYVMCDSYLGCDQEYDINLQVLPDDDDEMSS